MWQEEPEHRIKQTEGLGDGLVGEALVIKHEELSLIPISHLQTNKQQKSEAGERAQQLRVYMALLEDLSSGHSALGWLQGTQGI